MQRTCICWLAACLLLQGLSWTQASAQSVTSLACYQTDDQIRSPFASTYDLVIINCLSLTPSGSIDNVILSAFNSSDNVTARFTMNCIGANLEPNRSSMTANFSNPPSVGTAGCSSLCVDEIQTCSVPCDPVCARCVSGEPSNCTACLSAKLTNGSCSTSCLSKYLKPNPSMDMLCQCKASSYNGNTSEAQNECQRLVALAEVQMEEDEDEKRRQAIANKKLAIGLPIACFLVVVTCLLMSMFAHWKYRPHEQGSNHYKIPQPSDHYSEHQM